MSRLEKLKQSREGTPLLCSRTEVNRETRSKGWLAIFVVVILFSLLIYLVFFSSLFVIKNIEVIGYQNPEKIKEAVIEQGRGGWLANNIILFNKQELRGTLSGDPLLSDVYVRKILPSKIIIEVTESKPSLIWTTKGESFLIDERGAVLGKSDQEKLPQVFDSADIPIKRGDKVASPIFIKFITEIWEGFAPATDTKITKILLFDLITDVHVLSSSGWTVYLDASRDPKSQLNNLTKVLTEAKKSPAKLEYIDLRLDTKAFYK